MTLPSSLTRQVRVTPLYGKPVLNRRRTTAIKSEPLALPPTPAPRPAAPPSPRMEQPPDLESAPPLEQVDSLEASEAEDEPGSGAEDVEEKTAPAASRAVVAISETASRGRSVRILPGKKYEGQEGVLEQWFDRRQKWGIKLTSGKRVMLHTSMFEMLPPPPSVDHFQGGAGTADSAAGSVRAPSPDHERGVKRRRQTSVSRHRERPRKRARPVSYRSTTRSPRRSAPRVESESPALRSPSPTAAYPRPKSAGGLVDLTSQPYTPIKAEPGVVPPPQLPHAERPRDPTQWNTTQVAAWVGEMGSQYLKHRDKFLAMGITGEVLLETTAAELREDLEIESSLIRRRLLKEIARLKRQAKQVFTELLEAYRVFKPSITPADYEDPESPGTYEIDELRRDLGVAQARQAVT